jgi:1-acyl-sn-glycerol-3-phosphate acyltransferase
MRYAQATLRLFGLGGVMSAYYLRWLAGLPFVVWSKDRALVWRNLNYRGWARTSARIMGMTIRVHNKPPNAPFLLVSNHLSYIDVLVLGSQADCTFIAKSEVARWPLIGSICRAMDTIFIDRQMRKRIPEALHAIDRTLQRGLGVVLFAEGTSTDGRSVLPFKTSLLEVAVRNQMPVHFARIAYSVQSNEIQVEQSICWWGDMTFCDHLFRLLQTRSFQADLVYGPQPIVGDNRRVLAANLWSAVSSSQLEPALEKV